MVVVCDRLSPAAGGMQSRRYIWRMVGLRIAKEV
jgi:hypothetical protein